MTDPTRKAFEDWFKVEFADWYTAGWETALRQDGAGNYANPTVQANWRTWQAAMSHKPAPAPCNRCHCREEAQKMLGDPMVGVTFPPG